MTSKERRKNIRNNISIDATIEDRKIVIGATVKDISLDGIKIESEKLLKSGTTVKVLLHLNEPALLEGVVIWREKQIMNGEELFTMGIQVFGIIHQDANVMGFPDRYDLFDELMDRIVKNELVKSTTDG